MFRICLKVLSIDSLNLYLTNNVKDCVVVQGIKVLNSYMFSCSGNAKNTSVEKPQLEIISF